MSERSSGADDHVSHSTEAAELPASVGGRAAADNDAISANAYHDGIGGCTSTSQTTVIPTPYEPGRRKSRRGYALLIVRNVKCAPAQLPALARQQISWAGRMTHCTTSIDKSANGDDCGTASERFEQLY